MLNKMAGPVRSIQDACTALHAMLVDAPWYVAAQVITSPKPKDAISDKTPGDPQEIVVYVRTPEAVQNDTTFKGWPVRYVLR